MSNPESTKAIIASAARNRHTIIIKAEESDGSIETREAEPYSYRIKKGRELFFCRDTCKPNICSLIVAKIISVEETDRKFAPRWAVEIC